VASHGRGEEPALSAARQAGVGYVGLVASRRRGAAGRAARGGAPGRGARVHTPAGLHRGARTAGEVALSVLAEIVALRREPHPGGGSVEPPAAPATAVDPVCGITVLVTDDALWAERDGVTAYFCSQHCRASFDA